MPLGVVFKWVIFRKYFKLNLTYIIENGVLAVNNSIRLQVVHSVISSYIPLIFPPCIIILGSVDLPFLLDLHIDIIHRGSQMFLRTNEAHLLPISPSAFSAHLPRTSTNPTRIPSATHFPTIATLPTHQRHTVAAHICYSVTAHNSRTIAGHKRWTFAGHKRRTFAGYKRRTFAGHKRRTFAGHKRRTIDAYRTSA